MEEKILLIGGERDGERVTKPKNLIPIVSLKRPRLTKHVYEDCGYAEVTVNEPEQVEHYNPMRFEGNGSIFVVYAEESLKADGVLARLISNYKTNER
jgi:hypothetical protein